MRDVDEKITSLLSEKRTFDPPAEKRESAWVGDMETYRSEYRRLREKLMEGQACINLHERFDKNGKDQR